MGAPTFTPLSRRTKASLFVAILVIPETLALLLVCDILAAFMTFYVRVIRPTSRAKTR